MGGGPGPLAGCGDLLCGGEGEKRKGGRWGTVYLAVAPTACVEQRWRRGSHGARGRKRELRDVQDPGRREGLCCGYDPARLSEHLYFP